MKKKTDLHEHDECKVTIKEVEKGLEMLDQSFSVDTPSLEWFEEMIVKEREKIKRKWYKELSLFFLLSLTILTGVLYIMYQLPIIFLISQFIVILFIITYSIIRLEKKVNEV